MDDDLLKNIPWEQKQKIAAKCFKYYCEYYSINDNTINDLLEHLYSMEKYVNEFNNLALWEKKGRECIELFGVGLGDLLPETLKEKIPKNKIDEFHNLLEYTVEVGMSDMYAKPSNAPYKYLMKCINILNVNSIKLPNEIMN